MKYLEKYILLAFLFIILFVILEPVSAQKVKYDQNMGYGLRGSQVEEMQRDLSRDPDIYPEKLFTGFFGPLTERAVQRFQEKWKIVNSGTPKSTGYGHVGPKTRAMLNQFYGEQLPIGVPACHPAPFDEHYKIAVEFLQKNYSSLTLNVSRESAKEIGYCYNLNTQSSQFDILNSKNEKVGSISVNGDTKSVAVTFSQ